MNDRNLEQEASEIIEDALATFGLGRECPYWLQWYRQLLIAVGKHTYLLGYRLRPVLNPVLQKLSEHGFILPGVLLGLLVLFILTLARSQSSYDISECLSFNFKNGIVTVLEAGLLVLYFLLVRGVSFWRIIWIPFVAAFTAFAITIAAYALGNNSLFKVMTGCLLK